MRFFCDLVVVSVLMFVFSVAIVVAVLIPISLLGWLQ